MDEKPDNLSKEKSPPKRSYERSDAPSWQTQRESKYQKREDYHKSEAVEHHHRREYRNERMETSIDSSRPDNRWQDRKQRSPARIENRYRKKEDSSPVGKKVDRIIKDL